MKGNLNAFECKYISLLLTFVMLFSFVSGLFYSSEVEASPNDLVTNGSFEDDFTGWNWSPSGGVQASIAVINSGGYDGSKYLRLTNETSLSNNVFATIYQSLAVAPNTKYQISLRARTDDTNNATFGSWAKQVPFDVNSSGEWTLYESTFITGAETTYEFMVLIQDITGSLDIDAISIKKVIQVDELVTNGSFENDFNGWNWSPNGGVQASLALQNSGGYDGSKYLRLVNDSSLSNNVYATIYQTLTVAPNTKYQISLRARTADTNNATFGSWAKQVPFAVNSSGEWTLYESTFVTGAETTYQFMVLIQDITGSLDIDAVSIKTVNQVEELVTNGSFENGFTSWNWSPNGGLLASIAVQNSGGYDGSKYLRLVNDSSLGNNVYATMHQTLSVAPNTKYQISLRARTADTNNATFGSWAKQVPFAVNSSGEWTLYESTFVTGAETTYQFMVLIQDITGSLDIDAISIKAVNQVDNPGFENDLSSWSASASGDAQATFTIKTDTPYSGSKYLRIMNASELAPNVYGNLYQNIQVEPNSTYVLTLRARTSGAANVLFGTWGNLIPFDATSNGEWKKYKLTFHTGNSTTWQFNVISENLTTSLDLDNIQIEKTTNLIDNESFEFTPDFSEWSAVNVGNALGSMTVGTDGGFDNAKYLSIVNNSAAAPNVYLAVHQDVPVKPNTKYLLSIRARTNSAKAWYGGGPTLSSRFEVVPNSNGKWEKYEATITTGSESVWQFVLLSEDSTLKFDVDSVTFTEVNTSINGSFEDGLTGWSSGGSAQATVTVKTDTPYDGNKYVRITNSSAQAPNVETFLQQAIAVEPFSSYTITMRARTSGTNASFGGSPGSITKFPFDANSSNTWKEYKKTIMTGPEKVWQFAIISDDVTTSLDIDKIEITKVPLTAPGLTGEAIWYPEVDYPVTLAPSRAERYFRKTFSLSELPDKASLTLYTGSAVKVYINGTVLDTLVPLEVIAKVFDVTSYLTTGTNVIAIQARTRAPEDNNLSPTYWSNPLDETLYKDYAMVSADLDLNNPDGTKINAVQTDSSWKTENTLVSNWSTVGFNDSSWTNAQSVGAFPATPWGSYVPSDTEQSYSGLTFLVDSNSQYDKGATKSFNINLSALKVRDPITSAIINYTVKDAYGNIIQTGNATSSVFTNKKATASFSLTADTVGFYTISFNAILHSGSDTYHSYMLNHAQFNNTASFTINDPPVDVALSNYGIANQGADGALLNKWGLNWIRADLDWNGLQFTDGGPIYWNAFEERLNKIVDNNLSPIIILDYSTLWASTAPAGTPVWNKTLYRPDMTKWLEMVSSIVTKYKDSIHHWEVWNEQDGGFWSSPLSEYYDFLKQTAITIRSIDPTAKILVGGMVHGSGFLDAMYLNNLKPYFDIINIHTYAPPLSPEQYLASKINDFKVVAATYNDSDKPIWITEMGTPTEGNGAVNDEQQGQYFVRHNVIAQANGVAKSLWYNDFGLRNGFDYAISLYPDQSPKIAAQTASIMTRYLNGAAFDSKIDLGSTSLYDYKFTKGLSERHVLWSSGAPTSVTVNLGATSVTKVDMYGATETLTSATGLYTVTLTRSPIYLIWSKPDDTIDKDVPTATVTYTLETAQSVTATITPSESVTITNNGGSSSYSFLFNGSFTFEFVDTAGNHGTVTATVNNIVLKSKAKPVMPNLSDDNGHDTGLQDGNYNVAMNLWYGDNSRMYKLYENDVLIDTKMLTDNSPSAQSTVTAITYKANGTYRYYAELTNAFGTTTSSTHVVTVTKAAPEKSVLSNDNWDGDGSFKVNMNMWWGTNGTTYNLFENGILIFTQAFENNTPNAQSAVATLANRAIGTYEYRAELINYTGATSSETMTVKVTK